MHSLPFRPNSFYFVCTKLLQRLRHPSASSVGIDKHNPSKVFLIQSYGWPRRKIVWIPRSRGPQQGEDPHEGGTMLDETGLTDRVSLIIERYLDGMRQTLAEVST